MCLVSAKITAILPYKSQTKQLKRFKQLPRNFLSINLKQLVQNKIIVISGRCITKNITLKKITRFCFCKHNDTKIRMLE